ncbi:hypothetical protein EV175_000070 [Coemansia sp. RSA 1933]|nr:hypothetical protein EV175_000070 [Coemansia sp. RSA 1933]
MTVETGSSVSPGTTFELCDMESSMVPYPILQYTLVFKESDELGSRNSTNKVKVLKDSFSRLTQLYPIVLGHREHENDRNKIIVSEEDLSKERFFVHHEPSIAVDEFEKIRCRRDLWPVEVDRLLRERVEDVECLFTANVVCFKDNSGYLLSLSASHIVADVSAFMILLSQWASIARKITQAADDGASLDVSQIMPDNEIDFDHVGFWNKLVAHPKDDHPYVLHINSQDCGDISQIAAKVREYFTTGAYNGDRSTLSMRVLHISGKNLERMSAKYNVADDNERPLHGVHIFYALLWQRHIANNLLLRGTEADHSQLVYLNLIHDIRRITPAPNYVGNAVSPVCVYSTVEDVLTKPIIETARMIKSYINSITPGAVVHCSKALAETNGVFLPKLMYLQRHPESKLVISNASRIPFFTLDFGIGKVIGLHSGKIPVEGMSSWVPHSDGGVELYYGENDGIYNLLKNDPEFAEFVDFEN